MPNGHGPKEYGEHEYEKFDGRRVDCKHGCGCWAGGFSSGGPIGLDPFGTCPGNPKDGKRLGGNQDYEHVVKDRIATLTSRVHQEEELLTQVDPDKMKLAEDLAIVTG